jgi:hypothetical protein
MLGQADPVTALPVPLFQAWEYADPGSALTNQINDHSVESSFLD